MVTLIFHQTHLSILEFADKLVLKYPNFAAMLCCRVSVVQGQVKAHVLERKIACQKCMWLMITPIILEGALGCSANLPVNKHESMALVDVQLLHGRKLM